MPPPLPLLYLLSQYYLQKLIVIYCHCHLLRQYILLNQLHFNSHHLFSQRQLVIQFLLILLELIECIASQPYIKKSLINPITHTNSLHLSLSQLHVIVQHQHIHQHSLLSRYLQQNQLCQYFPHLRRILIHHPCHLQDI